MYDGQPGMYTAMGMGAAEIGAAFGVFYISENETKQQRDLKLISIKNSVVLGLDGPHRRVDPLVYRGPRLDRVVRRHARPPRRLMLEPGHAQGSYRRWWSRMLREYPRIPKEYSRQLTDCTSTVVRRRLRRWTRRPPHQGVIILPPPNGSVESNGLKGVCCHFGNRAPSNTQPVQQASAAPVQVVVLITPCIRSNLNHMLLLALLDLKMRLVINPSTSTL
jgi:hypothetical protein